MREALVIACEKGDYQQVKNCLRNGDNPAELSEITKRDPLYVTVKSTPKYQNKNINHLKIIRLLLYFKATKYLDEAWELAVRNGRYDIAMILKPDKDLTEICSKAMELNFHHKF